MDKLNTYPTYDCGAPGFCYLKDQRPISQAAYRKACLLRSRIGSSIDLRLEGDYNVINNLRLFSQIFTGFQLMSFLGGAGLPIPGEVPSDLDDRLAEIARSPAPCVDAYLQAIMRLPDALHVTPPNVFGEVGWIVDGKIVNHDTLVYLERIALLAKAFRTASQFLP